MICIINSIFSFLFYSDNIYNFFDNSTVAGIFTVIFGGVLGGYIYTKQKNVDRRYTAAEKLGESLILLKEHCDSVNFIVGRMVNTYVELIKDKDQQTKEDFFENSVPTETLQLGIILNDTIPKDISKIEIMLFLYFFDNKLIKQIADEFFELFLEWHTFAINYPIGKASMAFDYTKKVSDIPELSLNKIDEGIKKLINSLK